MPLALLAWLLPLVAWPAFKLSDKILPGVLPEGVMAEHGDKGLFLLLHLAGLFWAFLCWQGGLQKRAATLGFAVGLFSLLAAGYLVLAG